MYYCHKLLNLEIKEHEIVGLCSSDVRDEKLMLSFGGRKACREETAWEQAYE
jgi:hypothetical protein